MSQSTFKEILSYKSFVHAVSGAVGGFVSMTAFYPLDTVRTIFQVDDEVKSKSTIQVMRSLIEREGIPALYRGWFPVISSLWCSNFVYFYSYNLLKLILYRERQPTPIKDLTAASLAGIINVLVTTPMWVVNTRLKLQSSNRQNESSNHHSYKGIIDCFSKIIRFEGVKTLWNGTVPSLMLVSNPTIQFVVYEALKRKCIQVFNTKDLGALVLFLIGAIAKAVATIVTYPIQLIQSRQRAQKRQKHEESMGFSECFCDILRKNGFPGFFKGLEAKLLQTILMAALMFLTYEKISATVFLLMNSAKNTNH